MPAAAAPRPAGWSGRGSGRLRAKLGMSRPCRAPAAAGGPSGLDAALAVVNEASKYGVSGAAALTLLWRHDAPAAWCLLGAVITAFNGKLLKKAINAPRPGGDPAAKRDPGMPSSHAVSLAFLGTYVGVASGGVAPLAALQAAALFLTWLRVATGYHTPPQVVVGYALGASSALGWEWLGRTHALPAVAAGGPPAVALWGATAIAVAGFAYKALGWAAESKVALKSTMRAAE